MQILRGKLVLFLLRISMYSDTHFDGARYYVQGEAPLLSSSAGARRELRDRAVMKDSASPPLAITNWYRLINVTLASELRAGRERERTKQKLPSNRAARRAVTPVLMERLLGDEGDDASGGEVSPLSSCWCDGGSEALLHLLEGIRTPRAVSLLDMLVLCSRIQRMNYDCAARTQNVCFGAMRFIWVPSIH